MKQLQSTPGRPKLAPEDKKRACSVILSPKQEEAIKALYGTLTKAILSANHTPEQTALIVEGLTMLKEGIMSMLIVGDNHKLTTKLNAINQLLTTINK